VLVRIAMVRPFAVVMTMLSLVSALVMIVVSPWGAVISMRKFAPERTITIGIDVPSSWWMVAANRYDAAFMSGNTALAGFDDVGALGLHAASAQADTSAKAENRMSASPDCSALW
jgi:CDP-diglyceride synthetase